MRFISVLPLLLLAGCASSSHMQSAEQAHSPNKQAPTSKETFAKIDESNLAKAQSAGYKIVDENGKKLYCARSLVTGTRLHYKTDCLTEDEFMRRSTDTQQAVRPPVMLNYAPPGG